MMKLKNYAFLAFLILIYKSEAQHIFQKTFNWGSGSQDFGLSFIRINDGSIIISGNTVGINSGLMLMKLDSNANVVWVKTYGDSLKAGGGYKIKWSPDSNLITIANYNWGIYVIKTDTAGSLIWSKAYYFDDTNYAEDIEFSNSGNIYIVGQASHSDGMGSYIAKAYILCVDMNGNYLWAKYYFKGTKSFFYSISKLSENKFAIIGSIDSISSGSFDIFFALIDSSGNEITSRAIGYLNSDGGSTILKTSDNGVLISGAGYINSQNNYDLLVIKLDSSFSIQWSKVYSSLGNDGVFHTIEIPQQGYVLAGIPANLIKIDYSGNVIWSNSYGPSGGNRYDYQVELLPDNTLLALGLIVIQSQDIFLYKTDSLGNSGCFTYNWTLAESSIALIDIPFNADTMKIFPTEQSVGTVMTSALSEYVWCSVYLSKPEINESQCDIQIYPNPVTFKSKITSNDCSLNELKKIEIFDSTNRIIKLMETGESIQIISSEFVNGIYFCKLIFKDNSYRMLKFLIIAS